MSSGPSASDLSSPELSASLLRNDSFEKWKGVWTSSAVQMLTLFLVMILWSADNMALPAVYGDIARDFRLTPSDLAALGLARGVFESICALPAGFLADRLPRPLLICAGCWIWALGLLGCALAPGLRPRKRLKWNVVKTHHYISSSSSSLCYRIQSTFGYLLCTGDLQQLQSGFKSVSYRWLNSEKI